MEEFKDDACITLENNFYQYNICHDAIIRSKKIADAFDKWTTSANNLNVESLVAYLRWSFPEVETYSQKQFQEYLHQNNLGVMLPESGNN